MQLSILSKNELLRTKTGMNVNNEHVNSTDPIQASRVDEVAMKRWHNFSIQKFKG